MDSLYDTSRWNAKKVKFREHTFLANPNMPSEVRTNTVTVTVAKRGEAVRPSTATSVELPYGTPMANVKALVRKTHPNFRVLELSNADLRRLCRWLGSAAAARDFNVVMRYITTESSRYCPGDGGGYFRPGFDWQNPFHGINCTWGFHSPTAFPLSESCMTGERRNCREVQLNDVPPDALRLPYAAGWTRHKAHHLVQHRGLQRHASKMAADDKAANYARRTLSIPSRRSTR